MREARWRAFLREGEKKALFFLKICLSSFVGGGWEIVGCVLLFEGPDSLGEIRGTEREKHVHLTLPLFRTEFISGETRKCRLPRMATTKHEKAS